MSRKLLILMILSLGTVNGLGQNTDLKSFAGTWQCVSPGVKSAAAVLEIGVEGEKITLSGAAFPVATPSTVLYADGRGEQNQDAPGFFVKRPELQSKTEFKEGKLTRKAFVKEDASHDHRKERHMDVQITQVYRLSKDGRELRLSTSIRRASSLYTAEDRNRVEGYIPAETRTHEISYVRKN